MLKRADKLLPRWLRKECFAFNSRVACVRWGEAPHCQNRHLVSSEHAEMVNPYSGLCMLLLLSVTFLLQTSLLHSTSFKALSPNEGVAKGYACMQCGLQGDFIIALPGAGVISPKNHQTDCSLPDLKLPTAPDWPQTSEVKFWASMSINEIWSISDS